MFLTGNGITRPEKTIMSVMTPKGLVPAVLASLPLQRGLAHGEIILDLGYSIVLFSIIICSMLVILLSIRPNIFGNLAKRDNQANSEKGISSDDISE
jgi:NhaP-type Na+/H+ or K+/H+ antiporter